MGDASGQIRSAFLALDRLPGTTVLQRSSLYRTAPLGYREQPDFVNAVVRLATGLDAGTLLHELLAIEQSRGRVRTIPNGPRILDLDLLLYGTAIIAEPELVVPHPRMHERAFVLVPLLEIAPEVVIPERGPAAHWLARLDPAGVERIVHA